MMIPPRIQPVIDDFLPTLRAMGTGRIAITIGGSHGKKTFDEKSDVDFRVFADGKTAGEKWWQGSLWDDLCAKVEKWKKAGIEVDYCWLRTVEEIEKDLVPWLEGRGKPVPREWSVWGYHLLTDLWNQMVMDDPHDLIGSWQRRMTPYPAPLKAQILREYGNSLKYWMNDYHWKSKVDRGDALFLPWITARLVQDICQILFALNETYYVGDGNNLIYIEGFKVKPPDVEKRLTSILYPGSADYKGQYGALVGVMKEVLALIP